MNHKRKPDEIKKAQGTFRPGRENKDKPEHKALIKLPPAPAWMSKNMVKIYELDGEKLLARGILKDVAMPIFALYCYNAGLAFDCAEEMVTIKDKMEIKTERDGSQIQRMSGLQRMMFEAMKQARLYASEFGLTPATENRVTVKGTGEGDDVDEVMAFLLNKK